MGVVYSAYDDELDRKIALKVLSPSVAEGSVGKGRMLREAQALARLSHPNVVQVYEVGGVEGRLYLAMEYVEGLDLKQWAAAERRPWRQILSVYVQAGRGLAAAHAAGLVHRDFKPQNAIVGADGRVRVLDFGLARADLGDWGALDRAAAWAGRSMSSSISSLVDELTDAGTLLGTPAYMAPEQLDRRSADARSDLFAFCVALWEALAGARPFVARRVDALRVLIAEGPPPPPRGSAPGRVFRAIARGLAEAPGDRPANMEALLAALSRANDAGRRRWLALGVASTIAATAGISSSLARTSEDARAPTCAAEGSLEGVWDAERRAGVATALASSALPYASATWSAIAPKIDAYAAELAALGGRACVARAASGGSNSPILSAQERCLARRRFGLEATARVIARGDPGAVAGALTAVEGLEPLALCEDPAALMASAAAGDDEADPRRLAAIREAERLLAASKAEADAESFVTARGLAEEALAAAELLSDRRLIAAALLRLGFAQEGAGDFGGAESTLRRGYEAAEVAREDRLAVDAATAMLRLEGRERRDAAATRIWEVVAAAKLARSGDDVEQQVRLMLEAGIAVIEAGDLLGGAPKIRAAAAMAEASAAASERLKISALNLLASGVLKREGEMAAAQALTEQALARHVALLGPDHPYGGMLIYNLGVILFERGELEPARAAFERSLEIREGAYGLDHPEVAQSLNGLAAALGELGRHEEAIPWALRSLAIEEQSRGASHPELCYALNNLASLMIAAGRFDEAEERLRRARAILDGHGLATNSLSGLIEESLAALEQRRGRGEQALIHLSRALAAVEASLGAENPSVGAMHANIGASLLALGRAGEAEPHLARALVVLTEAPGAASELALTRLLEARRLWRRRVDRDRALALAREATAALAEADGEAAAKAEALAKLQAWLADPGP